MTPHHQPANVSSLGAQSVPVIHHTLRLIVNNFTIIIPLPCAFILLEWGWPKHKALGAVLLCTVCTHCNRKLPALLHSHLPRCPLSPEKHICKLPCSSSMSIRQYISNTLTSASMAQHHLYNLCRVLLIKKIVMNFKNTVSWTQFFQNTYYYQQVVKLQRLF